MPTHSKVLGERIKMVRLAQNLTLKQLEAKAGVSATHLSEIERGLTSPTVGAIARIAHALGEEPAVLVCERAVARAALVRRDQRRSLATDGATLRPLGGTIDGAEMSVVEVELPSPGLVFEPGPAASEGFWLVLAGTVELRIGNVDHVLTEGDAIHFADAAARSLRARDAARMLWIVLPALTV